jgi:putative phosphoribosyl transferase
MGIATCTRRGVALGPYAENLQHRVRDFGQSEGVAVHEGFARTTVDPSGPAPRDELDVQNGYLVRVEPGRSFAERPVEISAGGVVLAGDLTTPRDPQGIVVFAHGSGSGRGSPRNRAVAAALGDAGLAALLIDLLTAGEATEDAETRRWRFDVGLLGQRVVAAIDWLDADATLGRLAVGCFGASTGAAAALIAAAQRPERVAAVVSRGGRPDLAGESLARVRVPTLLIVGANDTEVVALNREAASRMPDEPRLEIVPGAGHLFEEPGALDRVQALARDWFREHLGGREARR